MFGLSLECCGVVCGIPLSQYPLKGYRATGRRVYISFGMGPRTLRQVAVDWYTEYPYMTTACFDIIEYGGTNINKSRISRYLFAVVKPVATRMPLIRLPTSTTSWYIKTIY